MDARRRKHAQQRQAYVPGTYMALGVSIGFTLGIVIGLLFDALPLGLGIGMALGAALGTMFDSQQAQAHRQAGDDEDNGSPPSQRPGRAG